MVILTIDFLLEIFEEGVENIKMMNICLHLLMLDGKKYLSTIGKLIMHPHILRPLYWIPQKNRRIFKTGSWSSKPMLNRVSKPFGKSHIVHLQVLSRELIPIIQLITVTQTHFFYEWPKNKRSQSIALMS